MSTNYPTSKQSLDAQDTPDTNLALSDCELINKDNTDNHQISYNNSDTTDLNQATNELAQSEDPDTKVKYSPIKITILGRSYNINCPVGEEDELALATQHINTYISELREDMPHIGYENLLVLCCLNLFNRVQQSDKAASANANANYATTEQARNLIDKMIEDMQFFKD